MTYLSPSPQLGTGGRGSSIFSPSKGKGISPKKWPILILKIPILKETT